MSRGIILSAIITTHNEGLLAHKTMMSVLRGLKKIESKGYDYEIIIHIDNGDDATKRYFRRYEKDKKVKIFNNKFGDISSSRNFAASKASGKYIAFLDGDDLVSDNWFMNALSELENAKSETIVCPEAVLTFGIEQKNNVLSLQKPSYEKGKDILIMLGENRWCSTIMTEKKTFQKILYKKLGAGYSHEDYVFNIDAVNSGIRFAIAKETVLFYRRSKKSRLSTSNQNHAAIPYMSLFDIKNMRKLDIAPIENTNEKLKSRGYRFYKKIRDNDVLDFFITPVARATLKVLNRGSNNSQRVPKFVIKEWKNINNIEQQLYPHPWQVNKVQFYDAEGQISVGNTYLKLIKGIKNTKHDYIFIVPWLVSGGADKVMLNYIKALHEIYGWTFVVIATLPVENQWKEKLSDYVDFIDFGNISHGMFPEQQEKLFTRLIVQLQCNRLHIINSEYGYIWARNHSELIKGSYELNISLFCGEYIPNSNMRGVFSYDDPYLLNIYTAVNRVFTDNKAVVDKVVEHNGFDSSMFKVHYQPINDKFSPVKKIEGKRLRILWAGRIASQKCPEVLCDIAQRVSKDMRIDVFGRFDGYDESIFNGISELKYRGEYDGFGSIDTNKYDIYLYTSNIDGVPNCLLEAAAAGLPIIAPNVGGIGEFVINNETGILINKYDDVDAFVEAIDFVRNHPEETQKMAKAAQELLKKQHSWGAFKKVVKKDF